MPSSSRCCFGHGPPLRDPHKLADVAAALAS